MKYVLKNDNNKCHITFTIPTPESLLGWNPFIGSFALDCSSNHCSACINFNFLSHNFNFFYHIIITFLPHNFNFLCHHFNIYLIISPLYLKILSFYLIIMTFYHIIASLYVFFLKNLVIITYSELFFLHQCKIFLLFFLYWWKRLSHKNVIICN